jgi:hypothetical protein
MTHVTKRRTFCIGLGAGALGQAGLLGTAGAAGDVSTVSTRGHFDIGWSGAYRTDGVGPRSYYRKGTVPGLDGGCANDLTVSVHGFQANKQHAIDGARDVRQGLSANGYDGTVVNFSWDSNSNFWQWWSTSEIARRNGKKLAQFTQDYLSSCPGSRIRYVAHSLGAQVTLTALETLAQDAPWATVNTVALLGPAVGDEKVSLDGRYGHVIQSQAGRLDVFKKSDDTVLNWAFGAAEANGALGSYGIQGPAPNNYFEHSASDVPSHGDYHDPQKGVLDRVADKW